MKFRSQFTLKTLFVLVAIASVPMAWAAYQLNWIRQRHEFLSQPNWSAMQPSVPPHPAPKLPWSLEVFGESPQDVMAVHGTDAEKARSLFPEAIVVPTEPWPHAPPLHPPRLALADVGGGDKQWVKTDQFAGNGTATGTGTKFIRPNTINGVSPSEPIGSEPCDSI